jgi:hypothetical protein
VFALGVTEPWRADVPGLEHAAHYVETRDPARYAGPRRVRRRQAQLRLRGRAGDPALGAHDRARLAAPVQIDALALSALRVRYLHPYDEYARGGPGTYVIDVTIERIEPSASASASSPTGRPGTARSSSRSTT